MSGTDRQLTRPVDENDQVLREIEAVLARHSASLFFGAPASLWIRGKDVGEVWSVEGDGSKLEPVDGWRS